ncbi:MAG: hypothetical protein WD058_07130 [Dehalococcoidia bacterium]
MRGSTVSAALSAIAGAAILAVVISTDELSSPGGVLGILLLLSAAVRFEIARRA